MAAQRKAWRLRFLEAVMTAERYAHISKKAKDQSCAKKSTFTPHITSTSALKCTFILQEGPNMFPCNKTVCLLFDDEGLNKVNTIQKHYSVFQLFTL